MLCVSLNDGPSLSVSVAHLDPAFVEDPILTSVDWTVVDHPFEMVCPHQDGHHGLLLRLGTLSASTYEGAFAQIEAQYITPQDLKVACASQSFDKAVVMKGPLFFKRDGQNVTVQGPTDFFDLSF
jgi:hypothetical protein